MRFSTIVALVALFAASAIAAPVPVPDETLEIREAAPEPVAEALPEADVEIKPRWCCLNSIGCPPC